MFFARFCWWACEKIGWCTNSTAWRKHRGAEGSCSHFFPARRYVSQVILDSTPGFNGEPRAFYDFLESCLRHKAEMVIFEAARAICSLKQVTARELAPAITVLQLFLSSSKPVLRFAAVRTLNKVAMTNPLAVTNCNIDMEALITDPNRSIATLAITTLLKACASVDTWPSHVLDIRMCV